MTIIEYLESVKDRLLFDIYQAFHIIFMTESKKGLFRC